MILITKNPDAAYLLDDIAPADGYALVPGNNIADAEYSIKNGTIAIFSQKHRAENLEEWVLENLIVDASKRVFTADVKAAVRRGLPNLLVHDRVIVGAVTELFSSQRVQKKLVSINGIKQQGFVGLTLREQHN